MATQKTANPNAIIQAEVQRALELEHKVAEQAKILQQAQKQIDDTWAAVKDAMVAHKVKSIKGDFGSITVAERTSFKTNQKLPDEYKKLAPDIAKIGTHYALYGEPPQGAEAVTTRYLTKRLK